MIEPPLVVICWPAPNVTIPPLDSVGDTIGISTAEPSAIAGGVFKAMPDPPEIPPGAEIEGLLIVKLAALGIVKLLGRVMLFDDVIVTLVAFAGIVSEFRLTVPRFTPFMET